MNSLLRSVRSRRGLRKAAAWLCALAACLPLLAAPAPACAGKALCRRVVMIGVDGMGIFLSRDKGTNFDRYFGSGAYTISAMADPPTKSADGWGSMFYGVPPSVHGLSNSVANLYRFGHPELPSIFRLVAEAYPGDAVASIAGWNVINYGIIDRPVGVDLLPSRKVTITDSQVLDLVRSYLQDHNPRFLFIHLNDADTAGHHYGFGTLTHRRALKEVDGRIGEICAMLDEHGYLDGTLLLLVTDHGGTIGGNHGGKTYRERQCLFAAAGPGVCKNSTVGPMDLSDVGPVVLYALGVFQPSSMTGKVPSGLFEAADLDMSDFLVTDDGED